MSLSSGRAIEEGCGMEWRRSGLSCRAFSDLYVAMLWWMACTGAALALDCDACLSLSCSARIISLEYYITGLAAFLCIEDRNLIFIKIIYVFIKYICSVVDNERGSD